jgi:hypothetical protein
MREWKLPTHFFPVFFPESVLTVASGRRVASEAAGDQTAYHCGFMAMILDEERMAGVQDVARYRGEFDEAV